MKAHFNLLSTYLSTFGQNFRSAHSTCFHTISHSLHTSPPSSQRALNASTSPPILPINASNSAELYFGIKVFWTMSWFSALILPGRRSGVSSLIIRCYERSGTPVCSYSHACSLPTYSKHVLPSGTNGLFGLFSCWVSQIMTWQHWQPVLCTFCGLSQYRLPSWWRQCHQTWQYPNSSIVPNTSCQQWLSQFVVVKALVMTMQVSFTYRWMIKQWEKANTSRKGLVKQRNDVDMDAPFSKRPPGRR